MYIRGEGRIVSISWSEEEHSTINGYWRSEEWVNLQIIQTSSCIGFLLECDEEIKYQKDNHSKSLDDPTKRRKEDGNEDHGYFPKHNDWFPVIVPSLVSIVKEPVFL